MLSKRRDDPPSPNSTFGTTLVACYTELLKSHQQSSRDGRPLLTDAGICYVRHALSMARSTGKGGPHFLLFEVHPFWDAEGRRLWLGKQLLKEFRQAGSNQVAVINEFQRRGWVVRRIDDPLPVDQRETIKDRRHHLQDTVKNLNRGLFPGTIHFHVEPDGLGVRWDFCPVRIIATNQDAAPLNTAENG